MTAAIISGAIVLLIIIAVVILNELTKPVDESKAGTVAIGGMLSGRDINYKTPESKGIEKNPIIKIMQLSWKFIGKSDAAKHAAQTPPITEEIRDKAYINDGNRYHTLDIYYPKGTKERLPVIIDIHGGGWMYAEKSLNEYYCKSLASRGFTVFNISYRLAPDVTVNQQLQDAAAALKWISENIDEYPCDPGSIMLTGDSAGGQLAAYSAVLMQSSELMDIFKTVDPKMKITALLLTSPVAFMKSGAVSIYTKSLWGTNYKRLDTYRYMNFDEIIGYAKLPPVYLITSSGDFLARKQTRRLAELLKSRGIPFELKDYEKYSGRHLPHVFSVLEPFDDIGTQTINDAVKFFKNEIKRSGNTNNNSEGLNR